MSRLAANIPLIKNNLSPLAFNDVAVDVHAAGTLGVYELNDNSLLRDVFLWAYERSASRYKAVRQSLGEPDPVRLQYRLQLREIVTDVIQEKVTPQAAVEFVETFAASAIPEADRDVFTEMVLVELNSLHDGNFARYSVRPSQFADWLTAWKR
ncbi:hypothetical protein [Asticcacaulis sp. YBE204]|uniref:hypothetical protein n=1 Tax=Asticcacaulis sp. YBE204 TaxID=1282363 RepID=UPI0012DC90F0|nr:hypothetical protein [Asticcacaulis sp. YBE204]